MILDMSAIREVRLHLERPDGLCRVAKLVVTGQDASLYLIPYALQGEYFYGARGLASGQATDSFGFRDQVTCPH